MLWLLRLNRVANRLARSGTAPCSAWQQRHGFAAKGKKKAPSAGDDEVLQEFDLSNVRRQMGSTIEHLFNALAGVRTGVASPGLIDNLRVELYGEKVPLRGLGSVAVRDPQLLAVSAFDPQSLGAIEKAISTSGLNFNPRIEKGEVLVPVPRLTNETLKAMRKLVKQEAEAAKVSIRHARKVALDALKATPSEDTRRQLEKQIQDLTNKMIGEADAISSDKDKTLQLS